MPRLTRFTLVCVILAAMVGGIIACSSTSVSTSNQTNPEVAAIRTYADPATQTTLEGLSEVNLTKYTQFADTQFKAAVTKEVLDKTATQISSQLGSFVSITFLSTEKQDVYTIVHYRAKFSKGEVGVRMVFDKDHLIAGQWFE